MKDIQIQVVPGLYFTVPGDCTRFRVERSEPIKNGRISQTARERARKRHRK